jgi:hypothetical protein
MSNEKPRVLVATPSYGSVVTTTYTRSLLQLTSRLKAVEFHIQFLDYSLICKQRNFFISRLLQEDFTHLLFIDADMGYSAETIKSLFDVNAPIAACAYPTRTMDWEELKTAANQHENLNTMKAHALNYVCENSINTSVNRNLKNDGKQLTLKDSKFISCNQAGTGLMLIQKDVAKRLKEKYPELWTDKPTNPYTSFGSLDGILQCFEAIQNENGQYISEDLSFCERWVKGCNGEIWVNIKDPIMHSGKMTFESAFLDRLVER